jgi:predicted nucleic acid-binding Zn ribbon protein
MYQPFQNYLNRAAAEYNFTRQIQAAQVCHEFRSLSKTMLPAAAADSSFPISYEGKILTVGAMNSACAQSIAMQKYQIIESMNEKFGPETVKNIKVEITARSDSQPDVSSNGEF